MDHIPNLMTINSVQDAQMFVGNSGVTDWQWSGTASADGFAQWVYDHCSQIDRADYRNELRKYLVSEGEDPADYGM